MLCIRIPVPRAILSPRWLCRRRTLRHTMPTWENGSLSWRRRLVTQPRSTRRTSSICEQPYSSRYCRVVMMMSSTKNKDERIAYSMYNSSSIDFLLSMVQARVVTCRCEHLCRSLRKPTPRSPACTRAFPPVKLQALQKSKVLARVHASSGARAKTLMGLRFRLFYAVVMGMKSSSHGADSVDELYRKQCRISSGQFEEGTCQPFV